MYKGASYLFLNLPLYTNLVLISGTLYSITGLEKTSRPGHIRGLLYIARFCDDPQLCPVFRAHWILRTSKTTLECLGICSHIIIQASKLLPDRHSFFIALKPPHKTVSSQTLSRWAADLLSAAGVDTNLQSSLHQSGSKQSPCSKFVQHTDLQVSWLEHDKWRLPEILSTICRVSDDHLLLSYWGPNIHTLIWFSFIALTFALQFESLFSLCHEHSFESSAVPVFLLCLKQQLVYSHKIIN